VPQKNGHNVKLRYGRQPARYTRASFVRSHIMARHLGLLGPAPAASPDWVSAVVKQSPSGWGMDGNDQYGDCCFADSAHQEMLRTANVGTIWAPTTDQVLALYTAVTGFNPNNPSTDNGADELTVIQYLTQPGWLGHKLDGHANLDPTELEQIKWVVCLFGASRLGLNLPDSAMNQFNNGQPWAPVAGAQLDGGHDVPVVKYDANGTLWVVTWGRLQEVTPAFMAAKYADGTPYVEEAHAELAFDWVRKAGTAPSKLNLSQLQKDLAAVVDATPAPKPAPTPASAVEFVWGITQTMMTGLVANHSEAQIRAAVQAKLNAS
jgi:hypothetical protein